MSFEKYGNPEKIVPLEEEEVEVIEEHMAKTGKNIVDLDDDEREDLHAALDE